RRTRRRGLRVGRPWPGCSTLQAALRLLDASPDERRLLGCLDLERLVEVGKALAAAAELEQGVAEVEGRVSTRDAPGRCLPHRLAGEGHRAGILLRADQRVGRVVQR